MWILKTIDLSLNYFLYRTHVKIIFTIVIIAVCFSLFGSLLLLENITSNEEIYEFVNETMKEDIALNDRLDKILQKIFKTTNPQLKHSLGAIRCGKKEIDFTNIINDGF